MIYIASPYSSWLKSIRHDRYHAVAQYTGYLMRQGLPAFSPIIHSHELANLCELPTDFVFWSDWCLHMLSKADDLHILMLDGWDTSQGVTGEIAEWRNLHSCEPTYISAGNYAPTLP